MKKLGLRGAGVASVVLAFALPQMALQAQAATAAAVVAPAGDSIRDFAGLIATLSETGGYFDTDNLISNEKSYLHVIGALDRLGVHGGAYIGVGPDQSFSYIAHIRPSIAFIIDIRRDNLLQHLLFKALFARARNRAEYLALWVGRPIPVDIDNWSARSIEAIVARLDSAPPTAASANAARSAVLAEVGTFGVTLSAADLATIQRFHSSFISEGLSLQFTSTGRAPREYYPTLRQLVLEHDLEGRDASYLAHEADFQFVKSLERRNLVVPVVGNLAGPHALAAIGQYVSRRGEKVSAVYTSNVEDYLLRDGSFFRYAHTVSELPHTSHTVIIRSYFSGGRGYHPETVSGYYSTQLLQSLEVFAKDVTFGGVGNYYDLVRQDYLPLKRP